ncbi:unnamed protein product, partial [Closterium sp. NIES-53]
RNRLLEADTFIDHFVVVGLHPEADLSSVEAAFATHKRGQLNGTVSDSVPPPAVHLDAQLLYKYPPRKKLALSPSDLPGFCFPNGVEVRCSEVRSGEVWSGEVHVQGQGREEREEGEREKEEQEGEDEEEEGEGEEGEEGGDGNVHMEGGFTFIAGVLKRSYRDLGREWREEGEEERQGAGSKAGEWG